MVCRSDRQREFALWSRYHAGHSEEARDALAEFYYPLVRREAARLSTRFGWLLSLDDLESLCGEALLEAIGECAADRVATFFEFFRRRARMVTIAEARRQAAQKRCTARTLYLADLRPTVAGDQTDSGRDPLPNARKNPVCHQSEFRQYLLGGVSQDARLALLWIAHENLTYEECADRLQVSKVKVKSLLTQARRVIRRRLSAQDAWNAYAALQKLAGN